MADENDPTADGGVGTDNIVVVLRGPDGEIKQEENE